MPTRKNEGGDTLISVQRAVLALSPGVGGDRAAKDLLAQRIFGGDLKISYEWIAIQSEEGAVVNHRPLQKENPSDSRHAYLVISKDKNSPPKDFAKWSDHQKNQSDVDRWNWPIGIFVFSLNFSQEISFKKKFKRMAGAHGLRLICGGVQFAIEDIEKIQREIDNPAAASGKRPRPPRVSNGPIVEWVAELVAYHHEVGVENTNAHRLRSTIDERLRERGLDAPSPNTSRPYAQAVIDRMAREPH